MSISIAPLTEDAWGEINKWLGDSPISNAVVRRLKDLGAQSCIIEDYYLDKDYSASYSTYYSKLYRQYSRHCKRLHFFSEDLSDYLNEDIALEVTQVLQDLSDNGGYFGCVVLRPTPHAPIARVLIAAPNGDDLESYLLVRAPYEAHLLGATLRVIAAPLTQQDSRVGSCAQATLWAAARHFHTKHRGQWISTAEITEKATEIVDQISSQQLPMGAKYLTPDNLLRVLRAIDRRPVMYGASGVREEEGKPREFLWGDLGTPEAIINRYLDSGIPVVIGLAPLREGTLGHAVLAVGHTLQHVREEDLPPSRLTRAVFCESILVNDDQRGPYLRMPISAVHDGDEMPYCVRNHVQFFIIPLPDKVFMTAEEAETAAWDYFEKQYALILENVMTEEGSPERAAFDKGKRLLEHHAANRIVARTYLTFGWKYHARLLRSQASPIIKNRLLNAEFPRYVWVTEFGTFEQLNQPDPSDRRIFGHIVIDATSSVFQDHLLVLHLPGVLVTFSHHPDNRTGPYLQSVNLVGPDEDYLPKMRGKI